MNAVDRYKNIFKSMSVLPLKCAFHLQKVVFSFIDNNIQNYGSFESFCSLETVYD